MNELRVTRRQFLTRTVGAAATVSTLGVPALVSSQPKELVIGGAASHKAFMEPTVIPMFEKKYGCTILFEGHQVAGEPREDGLEQGQAVPLGRDDG